MTYLRNVKPGQLVIIKHRNPEALHNLYELRSLNRIDVVDHNFDLNEPVYVMSVENDGSEFNVHYKIVNALTSKGMGTLIGLASDRPIELLE